MNTKEISNSEDFIDSRDIIARIKYLEIDDDCNDEDENNELNALRDLQKQCEDYFSDWSYGVTLINEDYFTEYAQELAEDIGAIDRDSNWPACHIDWDEAADHLKMDYSCVDFDGVEYWARS